MCDCGCNTCETKSTLMLNESLAPRDILSEGLKHHMDANKPLTEHLYRAGSNSYFNLWAEARSLYSREILEITHEDDLAVLTETDLGHYGMFEGKKVPLDFPMLEDEIDYEKEKTWKIQDKFPIEVTVKKGWTGNYYTIEPKPMDISYDTFIDLGSDGNVDYSSYDYTTGEANWTSDSLEQIKQWEEDNQDKIKVIYSKDINEANSNYPDFDLDKNIKYQDTSISSGMWRYTGKEQGGKGVYRNLMNGQFLGFSSDDFDFFKKHLGSHFNISESLNEAKKDIYDKFLDNPQNPKGRAKIIISKFLKQYGESATEMAVDRFAKQNDLKPEEKYILKYITKQDIKISSQPGGPDFSALEEAKKKAKKNNKKLNKPMRDSSGGKAYKVYVKDPKTGKIKTVRFGSGGLRAKINDKEARNAFAARHKCSTKKDKTKAGYWSCRLPRYAKLLGLKSNFTGFW